MPEQEGPFGRRIKQQRHALDLTQDALAERAGCSVETIRKLEAGSLRPSRQLAEILAAQLEIPPAHQAAWIALARGAPLRGAAERAPTLDTRPAAPPLPVPPTSFIGRHREIAAGVAILRQVDTRLLTLAGPGGAGKTRLALRIAEALREDFRDGVYFVPLAPVTTAAALGPAIAAGLGLKETTDRPRWDALKDFLREKRMLLALDNLEQIAPAAPLLLELLAAAPGLALLVTSREVLRLSGEHVFRVPPLSLPDPAELPPLEALPEYEAVALFLQRAAAASPGFALTSENAPAIAEICAGLDGLPLAIELAAARARLFSPEAMLVRLSGRLAWLTGGPRDVTDRQQTLRATLDWSYNLLDPAQQAVFARLAVFAGGCSAEAAEAVAGADLDALASLADKSLLQQAAGPDAEPRFAMLETVREYARERLGESGQETALRDRHAGYYATLADQAEAWLRVPDREQWLARLDSGQEDIRAALAWCLDGPGDPRIGLRLAGALVWYWRRRAPTEGQRWLRAATAAPPAGTPPDLLGWCQAGAAFLAALHSDFEGARTGLMDAGRLLRQAPDRLRRAHALGWLGLVEANLGQYGPARAAVDEALALFAGLGQEWDRGMGLQYSGMVEMLAWVAGGNPVVGLRHLEESYAIFATLGDDWARGVTINQLAVAIARTGNYPAALTLLDEGLRLARQEGNLHATVQALQASAGLRHIHGDYAAAVPFQREALALGRALGDRRAEGRIRHSLAFCMLAVGDLEQARVLGEESEALCRQVGDEVGAAWALRNQARAAHLAGRPDRAFALYETALRTFRGEDSRWFYRVCLNDLVALLGPARDPGTAATLLGAAGALEESMPYFQFPGATRSLDFRLQEENVEAARGALGAEEFARAWSAGRAMPPEQALDLALAAVRARLAGGRPGGPLGPLPARPPKLVT